MFIKIRELVISGGGIKGLSFLGAIYELEKMRLLDLRKISCASIGMFIAVGLLIGYTPKEFIDILFEYPFETLRDIDLDGFTKTKSVMRGEKIRNFYKEILMKKCVNIETITLLDLYKTTDIELIVSVCNITEEKPEYFSYKNYPDIPVFTLLQMTTALPIILPPVLYNDKQYVDGGVTDNCPIDVLGPDCWAIVCKSDPKDRGDSVSLYGYITTIIKLFYSSIGDDKKMCKKIIVDTGSVSVTSFGIDVDDRMALIQMGINAVRREFL